MQALDFTLVSLQSIEKYNPVQEVSSKASSIYQYHELLAKQFTKVNDYHNNIAYIIGYFCADIYSCKHFLILLNKVFKFNYKNKTSVFTSTQHKSYCSKQNQKI